MESNGSCNGVKDNVKDNESSFGFVLRVNGAIIDAKFSRNNVPAIGNLLLVHHEDEKSKKYIHIEVAQHLGDGIVRCIALEPIERVSRGRKIEDTGSSIKVPVGKEVLGRIFDVLGRPLDGGEQVKTKEMWPINRMPPLLTEQKLSEDILETGIKVIDLICPYIKGSKVGLFGVPVLEKQFLFKN